MHRSLVVAAILSFFPATIDAAILAAINSPSDSTFSSVNFFDPTSLALGSSFSAAVTLEGITLGGNSDVYVSSGNTVYHYDLNGNLLGTGTIGNDDVVGLSYHNGYLWAASNTPAGKGTDPSFNVTRLDPATLGTLTSFQATSVGLLTGISVLRTGIYLTGVDGIVQMSFSGSITQQNPDFEGTEFGPVSAVPHAVYTSFIGDSEWLLSPIMSDLTSPDILGGLDGPAGVAGINADSFFFSDGPEIIYLDDMGGINAYLNSDTDNFQNLSYSATATLPSSTPEPATLGSMGLALIALFFVSRRAGKARLAANRA